MPKFLSGRSITALMSAIVVAAMAVEAPATASSRKRPGPGSGGIEDATVVAVIDFNVVPYHWDFLASKMPQQLDNIPSNDLPLNRPPHQWLPGFPSPGKAFKSYKPLDLTLEEDDANTPIATLDAADKEKWENVKKSSLDEVHYYWMPGTKVIGAIEFGDNKLHGTTSDHGTGVTSVSVGNLHGTCPECLLVFLNLDNGNEAEAIRWAMAQPWIDVITNSYGRSTFIVGKTYHGPDVDEQRAASERGQTIFFSAGNGVENAFTVTNATYMSSEKGPDWLVTVGAVSPGKENYYGGTSTSDHASYVGAGKPVDVAGIGRQYPSAYTAKTVSETGRSGFSGTSNAAPTIAGTYARALYRARIDLKGPSRIQKKAVIAKGKPFTCGDDRPKCELGDGLLTAIELRNRLFMGAVHTEAGMTTLVGGQTPRVGEEEFLNEGHGTYFARETGDLDDWLEEFERIMGPLEGRSKELERPPGEREWMIVDSYCRQEIWGSWKHGYYREGKTKLPGRDTSYPIRSTLEETCPHLVPPP